MIDENQDMDLEQDNARSEEGKIGQKVLLHLQSNQPFSVKPSAEHLQESNLASAYNTNNEDIQTETPVSSDINTKPASFQLPPVTT